jgi:hypothetical protein
MAICEPPGATTPSTSPAVWAHMELTIPLQHGLDSLGQNVIPLISSALTAGLRKVTGRHTENPQLKNFHTILLSRSYMYNAKTAY